MQPHILWALSTILIHACLLFKQSVDRADPGYGGVVPVRVQPGLRPPQHHVRVDRDGEVVIVDGRDVHDVDGDVHDGGALGPDSIHTQKNFKLD